MAQLLASIGAEIWDQLKLVTLRYILIRKLYNVIVFRDTNDPIESNKKQHNTWDDIVAKVICTKKFLLTYSEFGIVILQGILLKFDLILSKPQLSPK